MALKDAPSEKHFAAGLGSGTITAAILQPLDLLKTRVQQSGAKGIGWTLRYTTSSSSSNSIFHLWRGTVPSVLRTGLGSGVYFTVLNTLRTQISKRNPPLKQGNDSIYHSSMLPRLSSSGNIVSGATARSIAGFLLMPLTVIKVRFESTLYSSYTSLWSASRDIYRHDGLRGFFAGFGATIARDAPYAGLYIAIYEQLKHRSSEFVSQTTPAYNNNTIAAASINFASATIAGATCSMVSNPLDVIKTRIQLEPGIYQNSWTALKLIVYKNGLKALFNGLGIRLARKTLSSAIAWTIYEETVKILR